MAPFDQVWVLFLTFPVLVWLLDGCAVSNSRGIRRLVPGFATGWWFGFGFFLLGLWWIGNALLVEAALFAWALPLAIVVLPAVLALFWGVATALARMVWSDDWRRLFALAAMFGAAEWLRGHMLTGFPWNTIGYAALFEPTTMQVASVVGLYGVSTLAVLAFSVGGLFAPQSAGARGSRVVMLIVIMMLIAGQVGFGIWRLSFSDRRTVDGISLRLMQPGIDQADKFDPEFTDTLVQTYLALSGSASSQAKPGLAGTTHLLWPESAFPFLITQRPDILSAIAEMLPQGTSLITGAARSEIRNRDRRVFYNSVLVINDRGEIVAGSDKVHLVPFGEYLPLQDIAESMGIRQLTRLAGGFTAGASRATLNTGTGPDFLPLICYEIIFPGEIEDGQQSAAGWYVNVTNDAWYGNTPGPYQHLRQAQVRAVEQARPVARVANNGISAIIDANGRILERIPYGDSGIIDAKLPVSAGDTAYRRYGDMPFAVFTAMFLVLAVIRRRKIH